MEANTIEICFDCKHCKRSTQHFIDINSPELIWNRECLRCYSLNKQPKIISEIQQLQLTEIHSRTPWIQTIAPVVVQNVEDQHLTMSSIVKDASQKN
jgi:hypothetical protein